MPRVKLESKLNSVIAAYAPAFLSVVLRGPRPSLSWHIIGTPKIRCNQKMPLRKEVVDAFEILELPVTADEKEARERYKRLVRSFFLRLNVRLNDVVTRLSLTILTEITEKIPLLSSSECVDVPRRKPLIHLPFAALDQWSMG